MLLASPTPGIDKPYTVAIDFLVPWQHQLSFTQDFRESRNIGTMVRYMPFLKDAQFFSSIRKPKPYALEPNGPV